MADRSSDKALNEFLSEAQEIVETFNRCLLRLDEQRASGSRDPDLVNDAFRSVHSLKGLAGLFGFNRMTQLAHHLENLLDGLRLGKIELSPALLDLLFESVDLFHRLVAEAGQPEVSRSGGSVSVDDLIGRMDRAVLTQEKSDPEPWGGFDFDPGLLSGLTEYEEHRLRENIRDGREILRLHAVFPLLTIDQGLDDLKSRVKPLGEVITLLPLPSPAGDDQSIALDVIVGSRVKAAEVAAVLAGMAVEIVPVPRKKGRGAPAPAVEAVPAAPPVPVAPAQVSIPSPPVEELSPQEQGAAAGPMAVASASSAARSVDLTALDDDERLAASLKSVSQTVRVDIRKLDHLMNVVGELALARAGIQTVLDELKADRARIELARRLHREMRNLNRKLDELQSGILEVRMVPLGQIFDKLSRVVRKISREAGKEIRLVISGAETELDKLIVEELSDPLMHVIRNCIDHGIEPAAVRRAAGKPEVGTISIAAEQRGNHVAITIEDDGQGLDQQKLVRRAVERGFIDPDAAHGLTSIEIFNLIFLPGLSTKDVPDEISGRGVGMDVVKTNIARLSGIIDVDSTVAIGTRLTITLPITLAIIQALVIRVAGRTFAVPLNSVLEALMVTTGDVRRIERREMVTLRGQTLPLMRLDRTFRLSRRGSTPDRYFVVVVGMAQHRLGIMVDELLGQQDIVIKSIGRALEGIPGIAGATELGGQQTVLVLDVGALVEEALGETEVAA
ncbi:MAG TPA: chemotaxis protein CheA [Polyangia bacterium]|nr:chemotaxis protein CheA [Polyangia bacterium]